MKDLIFPVARGYEFTKIRKYQENMGFWVYILRCADNAYYTGHTDNLEKRIGEHQAGKVEGYTSTRLPVALVFSQEFPSREEAKACERQIRRMESEEKRGIDAWRLG